MKLRKMKRQKEERDFQFEELIFIKKIGSGHNSDVYLVVNAENNLPYALKSLKKDTVINNKIKKFVIEEKEVLQVIDFPFCTKFYKTFKDEKRIYFLMEFVNGSELFDTMREIGIFTSELSKFYTASLILTMEYIHSKKIIYRDLKPENVIVDKDGFLKLVDFGTSRRMIDENRTYTITGTPHYMAPEIIVGKGYSYTVDLWPIGVMLYEFMAGHLPFGEDTDDPFEIYKEIFAKKLAFPPYFQERDAKKIILILLNKVPELRVDGSYANLKANNFFSDFDWDKLYNRKYKSSYIPKTMDSEFIEHKAKEKIMMTKEIAREEIKNPTPIPKKSKWEKKF